jgi:DNA polymerase-3 subunit epsilon
MLIKGDDNGYATLSTQRGAIEDVIASSSVYGIYRNATAAKKKLEEVVRVFGLCPKLMGLEKTKGACFSYALGKCKGACIGKESPELYNRRFELAFENTKMAMWEYSSAIAVPINDQGESVVIENWTIKGFLNGEGELEMSETPPQFDVDEYKIIRRFLKQHRQWIQPYYL